MNTHGMTSKQRKAVKRARRKMAKLGTRVVSFYGSAARRRYRAQLAFVRTWNNVAFATDFRFPAISGHTLERIPVTGRVTP